jgi:hypothetical protein
MATAFSSQLPHFSQSGTSPPCLCPPHPSARGHRPWRIGLCLLSTLSLLGCSTTWVKPGSTEQDWLRDKFECAAIAEGVGPRVLQVPVYTPYPYPLIGGTTRYVPMDLTGFARGQLFGDCMEARGWRRE